MFRASSVVRHCTGFPLRFAWAPSPPPPTKSPGTNLRRNPAQHRATPTLPGRYSGSFLSAHWQDGRDRFMLYELGTDTESVAVPNLPPVFRFVRGDSGNLHHCVCEDFFWYSLWRMSGGASDGIRLFKPRRNRGYHYWHWSHSQRSTNLRQSHPVCQAWARK
jgi:hypothetical protein